MSINIFKLDENEKQKLFKSVNTQLNIDNLQSYYPIFDLFINNDSLKGDKDLIIDSKYRCTEILAKLDPELYDDDLDSQYDDQDDQDNNKLLNALENIKDKLENLSEEDAKNVNIDELIQLEMNGSLKKDSLQEDKDDDEDNDDEDGDEDGDDDEDDENEDELISDEDEDDEDEEMMKELEQELKLRNTFPVLANVHSNNTDVAEEKQKIFVKKSPLLEPIKVLMDVYQIDNNSALPDSKTINTINKINSLNNCSHVEASFLFIGSKLVELGKCPTFPNYYGCLNGYDNDFHADITDEYDELRSKSWFLEKIQNDHELVILNSNSDNLFDKSYNNGLSMNSLLNDLNSELGDRESLTSDDNDEDDNENKNINIQSLTDNEDIDELNITSLLDDKSEKENDNSDNDDSDYTDIDTDDEILDNLEDVKLKDIINVCDIDDNFDELSLTGLENNNNCYFVKFPKMPVNICLMEYMKDTLDDLLDDDIYLSDTEWFSILFQVAYGLAVANKCFKFVHNDLHSSNVMFQKTDKEFMYFKVKSKYFKIPLFGKITKIIDFARATFKVNNTHIFSDVFDEEGEAAGQYTYPTIDNSTLIGCEHKPNPSFDLARLATTIIDHLDEPEYEEVMKMVKSWTKNDDGIYIVDGPDSDFSLYVDLAQSCHNAVPIDVLNSEYFKRFEIAKNDIPINEHIYEL